MSGNVKNELNTFCSKLNRKIGRSIEAIETKFYTFSVTFDALTVELKNIRILFFFI